MNGDLRELIRRERRQRGWSMRTAATHAGVSNTTWSRVEAGAVPLTPHMVAAIAAAFEWPVDWEINPPVPAVSHPMPIVDSELELRAEIERLRAEVTEHNQRVEAMLAQLIEGGNPHDDDPEPTPERTSRRQR